MEFAAEDEDAFAFDRQAVFVPRHIGCQAVVSGLCAIGESEEEE
jgi:hypothetical protein